MGEWLSCEDTHWFDLVGGAVGWVWKKRKEEGRVMTQMACVFWHVGQRFTGRRPSNMNKNEKLVGKNLQIWNPDSVCVLICRGKQVILT